MSEFSEFLSKKIDNKNSIKKKSIREYSREIGISHDYLRRIINGKVIAPEEGIQQKIAFKILDENEYQTFFDLAAKDRGEIPIDIQKELSKESKKWNEVRNMLEVEK